MKERIDPCVHDWCHIQVILKKDFFSKNFKVFLKKINLAQSVYLMGKGQSMQTSLTPDAPRISSCVIYPKLIFFCTSLLTRGPFPLNRPKKKKKIRSFSVPARPVIHRHMMRTGRSPIYNEPSAAWSRAHAQTCWDCCSSRQGGPLHRTAQGSDNDDSSGDWHKE